MFDAATLAHTEVPQGSKYGEPFRAVAGTVHYAAPTIIWVVPSQYVADCW